MSDGKIQIFVDDVKKQIEDVKSGLQDLYGEILKINKEGILKDKSTTNNASGLDQAIKNQKKAQDDYNNTIKESIVQQTKLVKAEANLKAAKTETNKQIQLTRKETNQLNRDIRMATSLYGKYQVEMKKVSDKYRDLLLKKIENGKLTKREELQLVSLEAKYEKYHKALVGVDQRMGNFQRNVGNYKSGYDGLSMSIAQLTREAPAFAHSMTTGFMAISNNFAMLQDEITKLIKANQQLRADGQPTINIWKRLASGVFSFNTILFAGVTLLTIYGEDLVKWTKELFKGADAADKLATKTKTMNKAFEEGSKSSANEIANLRTLFKVASDVNKPLEDRKRAVKELKDLYPSYLKNISDQKILAGEAAKAEKDLTDAMLNKAIYEASIDLMSEHIKKVVELTKKRKDAQSIVNQELDAITKTNIEAIKQGKVAEDLQATNKEIIKQKGVISELDWEISNQQKEINSTLEASSELYRNIIDVKKDDDDDDAEGNLKALEGEKIALDDLKNKYKERISLLLAIQFASKDVDVVNMLQKEIDYNQQRLDQLNQIKPAYEGINTQLKRWVEYITFLRDNEIDPSKLEKYNKVLEELKKQLDFNEGDEVRLIDTTLIGKELDDLAKMYKRDAKAKKDSEKEKQEAIEKTIEKLKMLNELQNAIADIGIALVERRIVKIEEERDAYIESIDEQIAASDESNASEEAKEKQKEELEKEKRKKEKEYQKEIAKEKTKQAKIDKAAALFEVGINTAIAVAKVWGQTGIFGVAAQIPVLIMGALQTAAILAQPIPKFKEGSKGKFRKDTLGEWGHGTPEVLTKDGQILAISDSTPSLGVFPEGSEIHKNIPTFLDSTSIERAALMASLELDRYNLSNPTTVFNNNLDYERMGSEFKKALKTIPKGITEAQMKDIMSDAMREAIAYNKYKY